MVVTLFRPFGSKPLWAPPPRGGRKGLPDGEVFGEVFGEMFGEVFRQHLTIRNAHLQRLFAHFGEVL